MAATNFTPISLYYSATASSVPTAGNLVAGELAINTNDGKLFYKDSSGVVQTLASKAGALGDVVGPASATDNAVSRFDLTTGKLIQNSLVTISDTGAISAPVDASISGLTVGKGLNAVASNTAVGVSALSANTTGQFNTGIGFEAAKLVTTGTYNTAVGRQALAASTTADYNTAIGAGALALTTGSNNSGLGLGALNQNTTGASNTAIGMQALNLNTTASNNTAVGYQAGYSNTTGTLVNAFGYQSAYFSTTAVSVHAFGYQALKANTTGGNNSAFGYNSLTANTTGALNSAFGDVSLTANTTGSNNTAMGVQALQANTTASNNTAVGYQALYTGSTFAGVGANTALGYQAGYTNNSYAGVFIGHNSGVVSTGLGNTFVGQNSGVTVTTGAQNTFIGRNAGSSMTTGSNNTILGYYNGNQGGLDIRTASNYIVLSDGDGNPRLISDNSGNILFTGTTTAGGNGVSVVGTQGQNFWKSKSVATTTYGHLAFSNANGACGEINTSGTSTSYVTSSDYRLKENVAPMTGALDVVKALKPVTYNWKIDGSNGQGFIAHELQAVVPDCVTGGKDAVNEDGSIKPQGIDTSFLVATLTAAIQELKAEFDAYKATHP